MCPAAAQRQTNRARQRRLMRSKQLDGDPLSLPIRLEFGPVLEVLAEAGYVGERLNEWLIEFNQANKDTVGKLELDAEGRLLVFDAYAEQ